MTHLWRTAAQEHNLLQYISLCYSKNSLIAFNSISLFFSHYSILFIWITFEFISFNFPLLFSTNSYVPLCFSPKTNTIKLISFFYYNYYFLYHIMYIFEISCRIYLLHWWFHFEMYLSVFNYYNYEFPFSLFSLFSLHCIKTQTGLTRMFCSYRCAWKMLQ